MNVRRARDPIDDAVRRIHKEPEALEWIRKGLITETNKYLV